MKKFDPIAKKSLLITGSRLIDPVEKLDKKADLLIENGKISRIADKIGTENIETLHLPGHIVSPGWFDMHVHFREPGREDEETIKSGCAAAAAGGFTGVCPMPNTQPVADSRSIIEFMIDEAKELPVDVHPIAAATKGSKGQELTEIAELIEAGAVAFSDDGVTISTAEITRRVLEYASMYDAPIIEHCEEHSMTKGAAMHEGAMSTRLGIPGMPGVAEDLIVARDILLAEFTGGRVHIAHISTARSVDLVREGKKRGVQVTCEVMPHHFCLTDESIASYDANYKMNPPLRTQADVDAMIAGLKDGTIDVIATDHAPHSPEEKDVEFAAAPFGILGLETALGLVITHLVEPGHLSLDQAIEKITYAPRKILQLPQAAIKKGAAANLTIFNPDETWTVDPKQFYSKCRNTPFTGWQLKGRPAGIFNDGKLWLAPR